MTHLPNIVLRATVHKSTNISKRVQIGYVLGTGVLRMNKRHTVEINRVFITNDMK